MTEKGKAPTPSLRLWSGKLMALLVTVVAALGMAVGLTAIARAASVQYTEVTDYASFEFDTRTEYVFVTETEAGVVFSSNNVTGDAASMRVFSRTSDTDDFVEVAAAEEGYSFVDGSSYILVATVNNKTYAVDPSAVATPKEVSIQTSGETAYIAAANSGLAWTAKTSSNKVYLNDSDDKHLYPSNGSIAVSSSNGRVFTFAAGKISYETNGSGICYLTCTAVEASAYAMAYGDPTVSPTKVTVQSEGATHYIETDSDALVWKSTSDGALQGSGERYFYPGSQGARTSGSKRVITFAHNADNKGGTLIGNNEYNVTYSGGSFGASKTEAGATFRIFTREAEPIHVTGVTLNKGTLSLEEGEEFTLKATVEPTGADDPSLTWASDDESVAAVDQSGKVTAVKEGGPVTITATSVDNPQASASCAVTVTKPAEPADYVLTDKLVAGRHYVIASASSGTASILGHDEADVATHSGVSVETKDGKATISTSRADVVFVAGAIEDGVTLTNGDYYVSVEGSGTLTFSKTVSTKHWTYKGNKLANVSSSATRYLIFGDGGFAGYYSSSSSNPSDIFLFVLASEASEPIHVTSVSLDKDTLSLEEGEEFTLKATVEPTGADDPSLTWESSDDSVATVDQTGKVTAVKVGGPVTITATSVDNPQASDSCAVTVIEPAVYYPASTLRKGGEYLIVSTDSAEGDAYALQNGGGTSGGTDLAAEKVKVIDVDGSKLIASGNGKLDWTAVADGDKGFYLTNGTDYLEGKSGKVKVYSSQQYDDRYWAYEDGTLRFNGSYFVYWNGSDAFTGSNTSTGKVYLFEKDETGADTDVDSVALDRDSLELEVGEEATLEATVSPAIATYKDVTWSAEPEGVVSVEGGVVTGLAEGTATVTASAGGKSATCAVTVSEPITVPDDYYPVSALRKGGEYLIVSTDAAGDAFALLNSGGTSDGADLAAEKVKVVDVDGSKVIATSNSKLVWKATANGDKGFNLTNGTDYLEGASGKVAVFNEQQYNDRFWSYEGGQLKHSGGTNTYTVYYGDAFTSTYSATTEKVYLFEKDETGEDTAVDSVALDKDSLELEVGESDKLEATVSPAIATDKAVIWSARPEGVVSVEGGIVTGLAKGTATITAATANGKYATCAVTVKEPSSETTTYRLTDSLLTGGKYLIVSANEAGEAFALTNPGGASSSGVAMGKTAVNVSADGSDLIINSKVENIVWTATANGDGFNLTNGSDFLEGAGGEVAIYNP